MTAADRLDAIEARALAATEAWSEYRDSLEYAPTDRYDVLSAFEAGWDARGTDVPALVAAVRAVLELHPAEDVFGTLGSVTCCPQCATSWPCPYVAAITEALGGES